MLAEELVFDNDVPFEVQTDAQSVSTVIPAGEITMNLPIIGQTTLMANADGSLSKMIPTSNKELNLGPLTILPSLFTLKPQGTISYVAQAVFLGKKAHVGLLDLSPAKRDVQGHYSVTSMRLGIALDEPLLLNLKGTQTAALQSFFVLLQEGKSPQYATRIDFFGVPTVVQLSFPQDQMIGNFIIGNKNLYDLFPELQNNLIGAIDIISANATLTLTKLPIGYGNPIFTLTGTADLTDLKITNDSAIKNVTISSTVSKDQLNVSAVVNNVRVPVVGTIETAQVRVFWDPQQRAWRSELLGHVDVYLKGVGTIPVTLASTIGKDTVEFKGSVDKTFKVAGITVNNASAAFDLVHQSVKIGGTGDILGEPALISLEQFADGDVEIHADLKVKKTLKPFKKTTIPLVKDFALTNPVVKIEPKEEGFDLLLQGEVNVFNIPLIGDIRVIGEGDQETILGEVGLPHNWKISDGYKELKGTIFDQIVIADLKVVFAEDEYKDEVTGVRYVPGVNFVGKLNFEKALEPVAKLMKLPIGTQVRVVFTVPKDPTKTALSISLPATLDFGTPKLQLTNVSLSLKAFGGVGFSGTLKLIPSKKDDPLFFSTGFSVGPLEASGSGSMVGMWQHPFGIPNIAFGNVAVQVKLNYVLLETTAIPISSLGMQAELDLGPTDVKFAGNISLTSANSMLVGTLDALYLRDIVNLASKIFKKRIELKKVPNVAIKDVEIYVVPVATSIGSFFYDEGFNMKGLMEFENFKIYARILIPLDETSGVVGEGYATKIKYGPLLITGAGSDNVYGTEDDGPAMSLKITEAEQKFMLTGLIELQDVFKVDGEALITLDALRFKVLAKINGLYDLIMEGEGSIYSTDLAVKIDLVGSAQDFLKKYVVDKLPQSAAQSNKSLEDAKGKVQKLQREIDSTNKTLKKKKDTLDSEAKKAKKSILKAIMGSPKLAQLASEISGLEIKNSSLKVSMKSAQATLTALQQVVTGSSVAVAGTVDALSKIVDVRRIYFEGSVHEIAKGHLPDMKFEGMLFGKKIQFTIKDFDLTDIEHSLAKMGDQIIAAFV